MSLANIIDSLPRQTTRPAPERSNKPKTVSELFDAGETLEWDGAAFFPPNRKPFEESIPVTFTSTCRIAGREVAVRVEATVFPAIRPREFREGRAAEGVLERVNRIDTGERVNIATLGTIEGGRLELDAIAESLKV
jgi:hypothetical protein